MMHAYIADWLAGDEPEPDHIATPSEARAEYARNAGADDPSRCWILTPWDTWEKNPHYRGPAVRHPEDDVYDGWMDYEGVLDEAGS